MKISRNSTGKYENISICLIALFNLAFAASSFAQIIIPLSDGTNLPMDYLAKWQILMAFLASILWVAIFFHRLKGSSPSSTLYLFALQASLTFIVLLLYKML